MKGNQSARTVRTVRIVKLAFIVITAAAALFLAISSAVSINDTGDADKYSLSGTQIFVRVTAAGEEDH